MLPIPGVSQEGQDEVRGEVDEEVQSEGDSEEDLVDEQENMNWKGRWMLW